MSSRTSVSARSLVGWISLAALALVLAAAVIAFVGRGSAEHATAPLTLRAAGQLQRAQAEYQRGEDVRRRDADFNEQYAQLRAQATRFAERHEPRRAPSPRAVHVHL